MIIKENINSQKFSKSLSMLKESQLFWIVSFAFLTFLSAQVAVPTQPVPFTLQTMLVLLSGAFLGSRNGFYSQLLYLAGGAIGLPIFAEYSFGFARLLGPTGGYLLAFPIAAYLVGLMIEKKKSSLIILLSMILGSLVILLFGALFLSIFLNGDLGNALFTGAIIFSIWDILKISAAFSIYKVFSKRYPKLPA
jgi:biotin transport system substrate-specific component